MKIIVPTYYRDFTCIAGACKHSCCIGWEIDIDDETNEIYRRIGGDFGMRLSHNIDSEDGQAHFRLDEDERCPFLKKNGLCDIILTLGEDHLCQICSDHPRFRNFFSDRTEIGLGLCCEAAGKLILFGDRDFELTLLCEDDEKTTALTDDEVELLSIRQDIVSLLCDRSLTLSERAARLCAGWGNSLPHKSIAEWAAFYRSLECLDPKRDEILTALESASIEELHFPLDSDTERAFERLLCYFIFRHLSGALEDFRYEARISFALLSLLMIYSAASVIYHRKKSLSHAVLIDLVRIYSSEIEYSEENMEAILNKLE